MDENLALIYDTWDSIIFSASGCTCIYWFPEGMSIVATKLVIDP
jgi:hypothetical protein